GVDVEADDVVAELGHGRGVHGAEVSDSDDGESGGHRDMLLSRGTAQPSRGVVRPAGAGAGGGGEPAGAGAAGVGGADGGAHAAAGSAAEAGESGGRRDMRLSRGTAQPARGVVRPAGAGAGEGVEPAGAGADGVAGADGWAPAAGSRDAARVRAAVRQRGRKA